MRDTSENKPRKSKAKVEAITSSSVLPLEKRGWHKAVRKNYIHNLGKDFYSKDITEAFVAGRVYYGMDKNMVKMVVDLPNRVKGDSVWIYFDSDKVKLLEMIFKDGVIDDFGYIY